MAASRSLKLAFDNTHPIKPGLSRCLCVFIIWIIAGFLVVLTSKRFYAMNPHSSIYIASTSSVSRSRFHLASLPVWLTEDAYRSKLPDSSSGRLVKGHTPYGNRCKVKHAFSELGAKHYLSAVIANRVFEEDRFNVTTYEIKQWIEYMFYAGVEHIYWYDTAHCDRESQELHLAKYVELGLMTYHRFHHLFSNSLVHGYHFEQDNSYRHFLDNYKGETKWVVEFDVDEYPFSSVDRRSCFLRRILQEYEEKLPGISQILMQCMFFLGNPGGDLEDGWLIEKYQRRKRKTEGQMEGYLSRQKPIFRSNLTWGVTAYDPHMFRMMEGKTIVVEEGRLRMNHYWGSRVSDFGPDTQEVLEMVERDTSIQSIADELRNATGLIHKVL